jgi:two-component system chemotaxis response regulator CheY
MTGPGTGAADIVGKAGQELAGLTILLAEDHDFVRVVMARVLRGAGAQVIEAREGGEALEQLAAAPAPPDILLCDLGMEPMDGASLISTLQQRDIALPIIILTGDGAAVPKALGPIAVLTKPASREKLIAAIRRAV